MVDFVDDPALTEAQAPLPTDNEVRVIATLATKQKSLEAEIVGLTEQLQAKIAEYRAVSENDLPQALAQAGSTGFTLTDGTVVELRIAYDSHKLTNPEALRWVEENGGSPLIKTAIILEMDRGDLEAAREIFQELRANRHANRFKTLTLNEEVNAQTIKAFVRRLIEERRDPPLALLGVQRRTSAVVGKRPLQVEIKGFARR